MTKARKEKGVDWHGKWGKEYYLAAIPGQSEDVVSVKHLPKQPYGAYKPASMVQQIEVKKRADEIVRAIKADEELRSRYEADFEALCEAEGQTYIKNGKTVTRRWIDFVRGDVMRKLHAGILPMEGSMQEVTEVLRSGPDAGR